MNVARKKRPLLLIRFFEFFKSVGFEKVRWRIFGNTQGAQSPDSLAESTCFITVGGFFSNPPESSNLPHVVRVSRLKKRVNIRIDCETSLRLQVRALDSRQFRNH